VVIAPGARVPWANVSAMTWFCWRIRNLSHVRLSLWTEVTTGRI